MEDDQNGRRPKWKTTKMEDDQSGRRPKWKTTKMEDDQNGRRPKWMTTKMEDDKNGRRQNGRRPKWKTTKMEDALIDVGDCGWRVNQSGNSAIPRFRDFFLQKLKIHKNGLQKSA